jgi:hypothetical protein
MSDAPLWRKVPLGHNSAMAAKDAPLNVFIGFIPEASRKDALEFAAGVAAKHCTSPENAYFGVTAWKGGFAYEVQEGGRGKQLLPSILAEFDRTENAEDGEAVREAFIHAGMRTVKVSRTARGVASVLLPEDQVVPQSAFVRAGKNLEPWLPSKTNVFLSGAAVFVIGALVLLFGYQTRVHPYGEMPAKKVEKATLDSYPVSQLPAMTDLARANRLVTGLSYSSGEWHVLSEDQSQRAASEALVNKKGARP